MTKKQFLSGVPFKWRGETFAYDVGNNGLMFASGEFNGMYACGVCEVFSFGFSVDELLNYSNLVLKFEDLTPLIPVVNGKIKIK